MIGRRDGARISVNKLGEYITSKAARQKSILYNQKYPPDYVTPFYDDASDAISLFIAGGMEKPSILENQIKVLGQTTIGTTWQQRRTLGNIEAIETFMGMLDDFDLSGLRCRLGEHAPPRMPIRNVEVSVRPEVILSRPAAKGGLQVGALKLHFPKTNPLGEEAANYVSAISAHYCDAFLTDDGAVADSRLCHVLDLAAGKFYPGVKSTRQRLKDVDAACDQIFNLWNTIKEE